MNNQFQDFSNRMIAKHKGFGQAFDSAPMVFPEQESAGRPEAPPLKIIILKISIRFRI